MIWLYYYDGKLSQITHRKHKRLIMQYNSNGLIYNNILSRKQINSNMIQYIYFFSFKKYFPYMSIPRNDLA
jgi:hypothetical protein